MRDDTPLLFRWRDAYKAAPELIANDRHVLHVVGDHMDKNGKNAFPSVARIVEQTALSKGTVLSSLAWTRASGWLIANRRSRREKMGYDAAIPAPRMTRDDRAEWARQRKERLAAIRVSRSERLPTEKVGTETHSTAPSRSEPLQRVGRNGDAEWVGTVAMELSQTSPTDLTQTSSRDVSLHAEEDEQEDVPDAYRAASTDDLLSIRNTHDPESRSHRYAALELHRRSQPTESSFANIVKEASDAA